MKGFLSMKSKNKLVTNKVRLENKLKKRIIIALILLILLILLLYIFTVIVYNRGNFSITLDKDLYFESGLMIYDDPEYKVYRSELLAPAPDTFDSMSYKWLPDNLGEEKLGTHNGDNYLAYTFLIENTGDKEVNYISRVVIEDVIKNVDEAVRIRIYKGNEYVTYAKLSNRGVPEKDTVPFLEDKIVMEEHVENFKPGDINKYTVVMWIEGTDPDCTDNILGGEFKAYMNFSSEDAEN